MTTRTRLLLSLLAVVALFAAACAPSSDDDADASDDTSSETSDDPILIGASLPLSGPLAGFGSFQKWGYEHAVAQVNDAGGIEIDGVQRQVELIILDDKTDPNQVTTNINTLISNEGVTALLGSCTPDLVNPGAIAAENAEVPFVAGCDPIEVFDGVQEWTWAWDIFFSVPELAALSFQTIDGLELETNRKVAILHDNGPDGQIIGNEIWPAMAADAGYEVVANVEFPVDNTDFTAAIEEARDSGADILLVDNITPQAVSLRQQMAAVGWEPLVMVNEKGAEPLQYAEALDDLSNGVMVGAYWDPSFPFEGSAELQEAWDAENDTSSSQHIADSYTAARVLLDAIARAGTLDQETINTEIGATDAEYPVGHVKFEGNNVAKIELAMAQWQDGVPVIIFPAERSTGEVVFPLPGS